MKDFTYEISFTATNGKTEIIAGFNNMYIAMRFYESFVEKTLGDLYGQRWEIKLYQTEDNKVLSSETN